MANVSKVKLNNGVEIPQLGLGVYKVKDGQLTFDTVSYALQHQYRLIDTAALYGNEKSVGRAIKESKLPRDQIFITTKLWNSEQGYKSTLAAFEKSIGNLGIDYLDLYLIHWPSHNLDLTIETWQAFEEIYKTKRVRAIGVSNFKPTHLEYLLKHSKVTPVVNQIELHPYNAQLETRAYCKEHNIAVESWSPLMHGGKVLEDPVVVELSNKYKKSAGQIVIRWHIQNGLIVIPKSITPKRIEENFDVFNFVINGDDMDKLNSLNKDARVGPDPDGMAIRTYSSLSRMIKSIKQS